jgi:hypothetical protein
LWAWPTAPPLLRALSQPLFKKKKEMRISNKTPQPNKRMNIKSDKDSSSSISKQRLKSKDSSCSQAGNLSYNGNEYIDIFWGAHQIGSGYYCKQSDVSSGMIAMRYKYVSILSMKKI